ncbi:tetratricopeptide repeat protein [Parahaliea maris]|nr:tetratricopeptide repeat protein [Parahaliea maris]
MAKRWLLSKGQFCEETKVLSGPSGEVSLEPRVAALLVEFLRHPGEVLSHEDLLTRVWKGRLVSDEAVRRAVSNLRHGLQEAGFGKPLKTLHKKGYLCELSAELQESRKEKPRQVVHHIPRRPSLSWQLLYHSLVILLLISLGVGSSVLLWRHFTPPAGEAAHAGPVVELPITIAVLPFANFVEDEEARLFADGMAEELITLLARVHLFRVTSRSSSQVYEGEQIDVREVGRELGVTYLIEGSVRRENDRLRVNAALINTRTGFQVWAGTFRQDRPADLLAVQADIAREVSRALRVVLVDDERRHDQLTPEYLAARAEYRKGVKLMESWHSEDVVAAIGHLQRAISIDPDFAEAYVALADVLATRASDQNNFPEVADTIRTLSERALELAPDMGAAYVARSSVASGHRDIAAAEADLRRGLRLSPSYSPGYERLAELLFFSRGDVEGATAMIDQAIALDPLRPRNYHIKGYFETFQCHYDEALKLEKEALRLEPRFRSALASLGSISGFQGNLALAVDYLQQALAMDPASGWLKLRLLRAQLDLGNLEAAAALNSPPTAAGSVLLAAFAEDDAALVDALYSGDPRELAMLSPWHLSHFLLHAALVTGDYDHAQGLLEKVYPDWDELREFHSEDHLLLLERLPAYLNMLVLQRYANPAGGSVAELSSVSRSLEQLVEGSTNCVPRAVAISLALAELTAGDSGSASMQLLQSVRGGQLLPSAWWMLRGHPAFAGLEDVPGYTALLAEGEALASLQRELHENLAAEETETAGRSEPEAEDGELY